MTIKIYQNPSKGFHDDVGFTAVISDRTGTHAKAYPIQSDLSGLTEAVQDFAKILKDRGERFQNEVLNTYERRMAEIIASKPPV